MPGPTRRHDALIPLTHDHHHALHNLRLLRRAAAGEAEERSSAARTFLEFFAAHSVDHFREEEESLFPLVIGEPDAPTDGIARVLNEHVVLHALVRDLRAEVEESNCSSTTMVELADLLKSHIRFEEDELFPAIERVAAAKLKRLRLAPRKR